MCMAEAFNPYREWLGLQVVQPNHYELLSLPIYEPDIEAVALAADRAATRVRSFRPGANAAAWSRLLDEIHAAKECLLSDNDKIDYDRRLRSGDVAAASPAPAPPGRETKASGYVPDDRYPPGMGPAGASAKHEPTASVPKNPELVTPASPTSPVSSPASSIPQPVALAGHASLPGAHPNSPAYAYPPAAHPYGGPPSGPPSGAPYANAPYAAPPYAMPMGGYYGGVGYAPPGAPMATPYAQPLHPYPHPGAYPQGSFPHGYGAHPQPTSPPPAPPPPVGEPIAVASTYSPPASFDPMAPFSVPGGALPNSGAPSPRVVGFAAALSGHTGDAMPAIPVGTAVSVGSAVPRGTAVAAPSSSKSSGSAGWDDPGSSVSRSSSTTAAVMAANREKRSSQTMLLAGAAGGAILLACVAVYVVMNSQSQPTPIAAAQPRANSNGTGEPQPIPRSVESTIPAARPPKVKPKPAPPVEPAPNPEPMPEPTPEPVPPAPMPTPEPAPMPTPTPAPEPPVPTPTPSPPPPTPTPTPTPEPATPQITKQEAIDLGKALTTAKIALGEQNFEEADKQLAAAEPLAKLPEHKAKLARLKEVAEYVKQFRRAIEESVAGLEAGATIKVGSSTMIVVVETFPDKIVVRSLGQNKTYPFQDLPLGLAVAIADMKLDPAAPENRVIKGSYLALDKRGDSVALDKAKSYWEEAQLSGVDTSHLLPFLSDKYDSLDKDIPEEGDKAPPAPAKTDE